MSENSRYSGAHVMVAFLAGAAAGVVAALLTTPTTGKENREKVREWAHELGERAADIPKDLKTAYGRAADAAKGAFSKGLRETERET